MGAADEKYAPNFGNMNLSKIKGTPKATKNMVDRRFKRFTGDIQEVMNAVMFDKDNYKLIKDIKKDVDENIVRYEEILTHLEGLEGFKVIEERRSTVRTKVKDALAAVEEARNKEQQQRTEEGNVPVLQRRDKRDREKQF